MAEMAVVAGLLNVFDENDEDVERRRFFMLRKRALRDTSDPFMIGDENFRRLYRMTPLVAIQLIERLRPFLRDHELGIKPHMQVLAVLRFLAEGSYQKGVSNDYNHPMSQPSFSRYLHDVIPAILQLAPEFISFPTTMEARQIVAQRFAEKYDFPVQILGAVDCTLPHIHTPSVHEKAYVNHKQYHSLNVQIVSDVDANIMNVRVATGSTNDKFLWRWSEVRQTMLDLPNNEDVRRCEGEYFILGDNGYNPSQVVLTPIKEAPQGSPEYRYTVSLCRVRCIVEQLFGIMKQILRCLNGDRALHYEPSFCAEIVTACAILYNFLRNQGMPMPVPEEEPFQEGEYVRHEVDEEYLEGLRTRADIIRNHFLNNMQD